MEFDQIMQLIDKVSNSSLTEFHYNEGNCDITIKTDKKVKTQTVVQPQATVVTSTVSEVVSPDNNTSTLPEEKKGNVMKAPFVGTFYNAPSPTDAPFVKVGDRVSKGQTLGIIEAMKLMNEIVSEFDGVVEEILIDNESIVEYGQSLFRIA